MLRLFALAIFLALALNPGGAWAQKRVALVIGNGAYTHVPELANPPHDAEDMAGAFKSAGYTVILGLDLTKDEFEKKLRAFSDALSDASVGVFYYSGHGLQVAGANYLVPVDAKLDTPNSLDFEAVRLDLVQRTMESETKTNILFLDACRNNPFSRSLARALGTRSASLGSGLAAAESGAGTLISYSTQPNNVALDGEGRNSPYTGPLVKHIAAKGEDVLDVLRQVRKEVIAATGARQVPWDTNALTERFYVNPDDGASAGQPASLSTASPSTSTEPAATGAAADWLAVRSSGSEAALRAYIDKYPGDPIYRQLATEKLAEVSAMHTPKSAEPQVAMVNPPASLTPSAPAAPPESQMPENAENALGLTLSARAKIQAVLAQGGAKIGYIGGIYGEDTRSALRDYQRSRGDAETGFLTAAERDVLIADFKKAGPQSFPYFMNLTPDDLGTTPDPRLVKAVTALSSAQIRYIYIGDTLYIAAIDFGTDWNTAEQTAEAAGGRLAIISNAAINDKVAKLYYDNTSSFTTQQNPEGKTLYNGAWIGLVRDPSAAPPREGWHWVDGSKLGYRNWLSDSPGQWGSKVPLNCARFQSHPSPDPIEAGRPHQWGNTNCNEPFNSFAIEIPK